MSGNTQAVVEQLYENLKRENIEKLLALFDPSVEILTPQALPWSTGHYVGLEGATAYFANALEYLDDTGFAVDEIRTSGDWAAAIGSWYGRFRATGRDFDVRFVHFWTIRDGKVVRGEGISDTYGIVRAFEDLEKTPA